MVTLRCWCGWWTCVAQSNPLTQMKRVQDLLADKRTDQKIQYYINIIVSAYSSNTQTLDILRLRFVVAKIIGGWMKPEPPPTSRTSRLTEGDSALRGLCTAAYSEVRLTRSLDHVRWSRSQLAVELLEYLRRKTCIGCIVLLPTCGPANQILKSNEDQKEHVGSWGDSREGGRGRQIFSLWSLS